MGVSDDGLDLIARCRGCGERRSASPRACARCGEGRFVAHLELDRLTIAHLDCDAFYAAIEKRDAPELRAKPVIVGGGRRGVVATCCYVARAFGVRSAMPMFKALALCPQAVVIRPDIAKYRAEGLRIRAMMEALTPKVQPLSLDEAYMDLSGLEALHGGPAARTLIGLQTRIEAETGLTVSIGLAANKALAKLASDLDKPRGFSVIGAAEARERLAPLPVTRLPGVGPAAAKALEGAGVRVVGDLIRVGEAALVRRFDAWGARLFALAQGLDDRPVDPDAERKSLSAETTFDDPVAGIAALEDRLWPLCEKVAARARAAGEAGWTITLKLKSTDFRTLTRRRTLTEPTILAARLFEAGRTLLAEAVRPERSYRLIGIGLSGLAPAEEADRGDLIDQTTPRRAAAEAAVALARGKYGAAAVVTGRTLRRRPRGE